MKNKKFSIIFISLITAMAVGIINTASALIAYTSFIPKKDNAATSEFITETPFEAPLAQVSTSTPDSNQQTAKSTNYTVAVRSKPQIAVGEQAQPATIVRTADGQTKYLWCCGSNPNLEDGVCEAIISLASSPTADNPHLSDRGKKSLSLMPEVKSLTMDESSWKPISNNSGTMLVTADTAEYGKVKLKVTLNKINEIWVVTDGQLA